MLSELKIILFIIVSAVLIWLSWSSLRDFRSHGFYRFFAFELILVLILLNLEYWFCDPFSIPQIISWILLIISLVLVINGFQLLHKAGKPDSDRKNSSLFKIEKTTELVAVGVYRYIRHPAYGSLLFLAWGTFFKQPTWIGLAISVFATVFLTTTAKKEEVENIKFFGEAYKDYTNKTKMFIPFLF